MANTPAKRITLRTLALDPGTREMGYAVLEEGELIYFGVHTFKRRRSARSLLAEGQRFVQGLVENFRPSLFVIEKTFYAKSKRSSLLHVFVDEMLRLAKGRRMRVLSFAPSTVKKSVTGDGAATKREVARRMIHAYPFLERYLRTDLRTQEKYWENMFDAVALARTGYEDVLRREVMQALEAPPAR